MLESYIPIFAMILAGIGFGVVAVKAHEILGPHKRTAQKESTYESGMQPISTARDRFSVKFYLVAMLFILFDIEVVFMYPWATSFRDLGTVGLWSMLLFIVTLFVGYVYIVRKGALRWD